MNGKFYQKAVVLIVLLAILIIFINSAYALTGSIGNARMFLKAEVGETLEKYVLVKNVNDVPVNISLAVTGNLTKETKLEEDNFVLQAGEERKAYFTIKAKKPGVYETRVLVQFSSLEEGKTGVGLSSVITLKVYGKGELPEDSEEDTNSTDTNEDNNTGITGAAISERGTSPVLIILPLTTLILLVVFLFILKKTKSKFKKQEKKRAGRSS